MIFQKISYFFTDVIQLALIKEDRQSGFLSASDITWHRLPAFFNTSHDQGAQIAKICTRKYILDKKYSEFGPKIINSELVPPARKNGNGHQWCLPSPLQFEIPDTERWVNNASVDDDGS